VTVPVQGDSEQHDEAQSLAQEFVSLFDGDSGPNEFLHQVSAQTATLLSASVEFTPDHSTKGETASNTRQWRSMLKRNQRMAGSVKEANGNNLKEVIRKLKLVQ
jgi:hypothetical protein